MCRPIGTLPHSSFSLPLLISCAASPFLLHSLCLWLIPLIRLIKLNVSLGQDWWRTGGWRGQDRACCRAAVMMSNGVESRNCTFGQWASGGRAGFSRIRLLYRAGLVKSGHFWQRDDFWFYCIFWSIWFHGKPGKTQINQTLPVLPFWERHPSNQQGLSGRFRLRLHSVPSELMSPSWHCSVHWWSGFWSMLSEAAGL